MNGSADTHQLFWECVYKDPVYSQVLLVVKNLFASAGDIRDTGSISGSGRSPGWGHGNPLQYSCLENLMDWETWQATVHRVANSQTWLKWLNTHLATKNCIGMKSLSCVQLLATPWTAAHQAPPCMGFSRQEYWSGLPFPPPGDLLFFFFFIFKLYKLY